MLYGLFLLPFLLVLSVEAVQLTINPNALTVATYSEFTGASKNYELTWKATGSDTGNCHASWQEQENKWIAFIGNGNNPYTSCDGFIVAGTGSQPDGTYQRTLEVCSCESDDPDVCEGTTTDCDTQTFTIKIGTSSSSGTTETGGGGGTTTPTGGTTEDNETSTNPPVINPPVTPKYTLNVQVTGTGTITSSPAGIICGGDCSEPYNEGTSVTLQAIPQEGFIFTGWSGACNVDSKSCSLLMSEVKNVTATFVVLPPITVQELSLVEDSTVSSVNTRRTRSLGELYPIGNSSDLRMKTKGIDRGATYILTAKLSDSVNDQWFGQY
jgi:hypothetical protein